MIIYMFSKICVTNRHLCNEDFLQRIEKIAASKPDAIILREKDMDENSYEVLASQVMAICKKYSVNCILHTFIQAAIRLEAQAIHLPLNTLRMMSENEKCKFKVLGASCHSVDEAKAAQALGCTYITAGHIFDTDCKRGLPGRGLDFLSDVCESINIPVYAIGGISKQNIEDVYRQGAKGICMMKAYMQCENPITII